MATQFAVDLVFKSQGTSKLKDATDKLGDLEKKARGAQQGATNAANGIRGFGRAAAGASAGVRTFGAAVQAALGPLAILGGAVGTISAAFQTLSAQDFAQAKVKSLGVNAKQLTKNLQEVSRELQGQKSVVELTAAAYDVASAGFADAASASAVLKAASQGAIGGFSDLNTVANATTSVLNAYGMSAANAGNLVDQFIQTQNDGKIVVAEYAANIGKVASAAAGLGIPLSEVNAVIAQSTASGVQAEVAFTGLKAALARLASGEASNAIKETGVQIDAASLKTDGLVGTFKKLKDAGLDTGQIFKALGTEAGPALLPVLNNLEKYQKLVENQKNAQGAAAQATLLATDTIQGAWNRLTAAFQNLFADQSELGVALKVILSAAAGLVEGLAAAIKTLLAPIRAVITILGEIGKAFGLIKDGQNLLMELNKLWFEAQGAAQTFADVIVYTGQVVGEKISGMIQWVQGLFNSIAQGAQQIVPAITSPFQQAFDNAKAIIQNFWNSLPGWLKGALSAAGNIAGGIAKAVTGALGSVAGQVKGAISGYVAAAKGSAGSLFAGNVPQAPAGGGAPAAAAGGGGGGKGAGGVDQTAQLQQQLALKQQLFSIEQQMQAAILAGDKVQIQALERKKIEAELDNAIALAKGNGLKVEIARLEAAEKLGKLDFEAAKKEQDRKKNLEDMLTKFDREIELAGIKGEEAKKLKQIEYDILDLRKQGLLVGDEEIEKYRQRAQAAAQAGGGDKGKLQEYMSNLQKELGDTEGMITDLAQTIEGEIGSAMSSAVMGMIDGTKTAQEAFSDMLKGIGKAFIDMATQMIAKYVMLIAMQALFRALGGPSLGGGGGSFSQGLSMDGTLAGGGIFSGEGPYKFAEGGYVTGPTNALIGEAGESEYVIPSSKMGAAMANYRSGKRGDSVVSDSAMGSDAEDGGNNTFTLETVVINKVEYATVAQVREMGAAAAKRGAEGGYTKTMGSMRNSRSTRARLGMG